MIRNCMFIILSNLRQSLRMKPMHFFPHLLIVAVYCSPCSHLPPCRMPFPALNLWSNDCVIQTHLRNKTVYSRFIQVELYLCLSYPNRLWSALFQHFCVMLCSNRALHAFSQLAECFFLKPVFPQCFLGKVLWNCFSVCQGRERERMGFRGP